MQGRTAMAHALGDAVTPLRMSAVSSNVFTDPEIATVGVSAADAEANSDIEAVMMPLSRNPRAKMLGIREGFVKLFAYRGTGTVLGGVIVATEHGDRKSTRLNSSHVSNSYAVFCMKKKNR